MPTHSDYRWKMVEAMECISPAMVRGFRAWDVLETATNPYALDDPRHAAWAKGYDKARMLYDYEMDNRR